jgi:predicted RNase H-related nuclease YkuK (DUF458 family)
MTMEENEVERQKEIDDLKAKMLSELETKEAQAQEIINQLRGEVRDVKLEADAKADLSKQIIDQLTGKLNQEAPLLAGVCKVG